MAELNALLNKKMDDSDLKVGKGAAAAVLCCCRPASPQSPLAPLLQFVRLVGGCDTACGRCQQAWPLCLQPPPLRPTRTRRQSALSRWRVRSCGLLWALRRWGRAGALL